MQAAPASDLVDVYSFSNLVLNRPLADEGADRIDTAAAGGVAQNAMSTLVESLGARLSDSTSAFGLDMSSMQQFGSSFGLQPSVLSSSLFAFGKSAQT